MEGGNKGTNESCNDILSVSSTGFDDVQDGKDGVVKTEGDSDEAFEYTEDDVDEAIECSEDDGNGNGNGNGDLSNDQRTKSHIMGKRNNGRSNWRIRWICGSRRSSHCFVMPGCTLIRRGVTNISFSNRRRKKRKRNLLASSISKQRVSQVLGCWNCETGKENSVAVSFVSRLT